MNRPPYDIFPILIGDRISLRQIETPDIEELVQISFYDAIQATSWQEAAEMQARINRDYSEGSSIHWGIADNRTNKIVGTCGYYRGLDKGAGELGCVLLPKYYGQGFMTSAMLLAIDFGWNHMGLSRIWATTNRQNEKAIKLLERLNFIKVADLADGDIEYELRQDI